jgi:integrase
MASLFKKTIVKIDPKTGRKIKRKSAKWWGKYKDVLGISRRVPLCTDKAASQVMLNDLVTKADREKVGMGDRFEDQHRTPLRVHLDDFEGHLRSKGVSAEQVKLVVGRCRKIVDGCGFTYIGDLAASRVQTYLAELRTAGASIQTSNHYLRAVKQFTRWLVRDRRTNDDRLAHMSGGNVKLDRRHDRRALTNDELGRLIDAAQTGPVVLGMTGPDRAMLYGVAVSTGLRASELASLTPESFDLDRQPPTVTVEAAYSKHRRQDVLPLRPNLVPALQVWLGENPAGCPVWPGKWAKAKLAGLMLKRDLKAAGVAYVDEDGRYADFHSLRHTFITRLAMANVPVKVAQSLARHSDVNLTPSRYAHVGVFDQASAIASLPLLCDREADAMRMTGTGGRSVVPPVVPKMGHHGCLSVVATWRRLASPPAIVVREVSTQWQP